MTVRATKRGAERTSLDGERVDVVVCGASFAGLAVARELAGAGASVLVIDRYEIGERPTSACAAPTPWLEAMGVASSIRQELPCMRFSTPHGSFRYRLPWSWSSFDYRALCLGLWAQCGD
jgi:flavin-dependent dehydrogenase